MKADAERTSVGFWIGLAVGGAVTLYGLHGLLTARGGLTPREFVGWFIGGDILHDAVVAPIVCLAGVAIVRWAPASLRAPLRSGLFISAIVLFVAWAPLHGYGHDSAPGNSSVQPLDYTTAVLTVLALVWAGVITW